MQLVELLSGWNLKTFTDGRWVWLELLKLANTYKGLQGLVLSFVTFFFSHLEDPFYIFERCKREDEEIISNEFGYTPILNPNKA